MQATQQLINNWTIGFYMLVSIAVIGPFNYYGTNLTKYSSAMHRCLIDASRMCVVWLFSVANRWEHFMFQQAVGYLIIIAGNLLYYQVNFLNNKIRLSLIASRNKLALG